MRETEQETKCLQQLSEAFGSADFINDAFRLVRFWTSRMIFS